MPSTVRWSCIGRVQAASRYLAANKKPDLIAALGSLEILKVLANLSLRNRSDSLPVRSMLTQEVGDGRKSPAEKHIR
jgi:hypothetical protein